MTSPELAYQRTDGNRGYKNILTGRDDYLSVTSILNTLPNGYDKIPAETLRKASQRGEYVHSLYENDNACDPNEIPPLDIATSRQDKASLCAFKQEWREHVHHHELTVFNDTLGYAGTLDVIADFGSTIGLILGDVKTSRDISASVPYQLAAYGSAEYALKKYSIGWKRIQIPAVDNYAVIYIRDERHELIPVTITPEIIEQWQALVKAHRLITQMHQTGPTLIRRAITPPTTTVFDERLAAIRERISHLQPEALEVLRQKMVEHQISLKTVTSHEQLTTVDEYITKYDKRYGTKPANWDSAAFADFETQYDALPPDLRMQAETASKRYGVPNLRCVHVRQHHLDYATKQLHIAMDIQDKRATKLSRVAHHVLTETDDIFETLKIVATHVTQHRSEPTNDYAMLQELEHQHALKLFDAIEAGLVQIVDGNITTAETALSTLIKAHGSKTAVLKAGKAAADVMELPRPRSSEDVAATAMLAAAVNNSHKQIA